MNILQLSFHASPFSEIGKNDGGGMSVYVQQISKHLSQKHNVTVVTGEKAESFKNKNLEFISLDIFEPELNVDCLLYTSPSPRDQLGSRMPSSA